VQLGVHVVGIASTIDNDLVGSDPTIGVDTALNVALEAIDRLKVTASSHHRAFLVEVMGRDCGYLALMAGLAGGAEVIVIPEIRTTPEQVEHAFRAVYARNKAHAIAVVAEGAQDDAQALQAYFRTHHARLGFELRVTTLGHVQRGSDPIPRFTGLCCVVPAHPREVSLLCRSCSSPRSAVAGFLPTPPRGDARASDS
jgi:6-phosphofructokinase 1